MGIRDRVLREERVQGEDDGLRISNMLGSGNVLHSNRDTVMMYEIWEHGKGERLATCLLFVFWDPCSAQSIAAAVSAESRRRFYKRCSPHISAIFKHNMFHNDCLLPP